MEITIDVVITRDVLIMTRDWFHLWYYSNYEVAVVKSDVVVVIRDLIVATREIVVVTRDVAVATKDVIVLPEI